MQWDMRSRLAVTFGAGILLALAGTAAWPQSGRTIRLILPFPPGGPADVMARAVADQIGSSGGPTMVIESHPGAGTEIGTDVTPRRPGDPAVLVASSERIQAELGWRADRDLRAMIADAWDFTQARQLR